MHCCRFALGPVEYMLVAQALDLPESRKPLTCAEREVAMGLLRGWTHDSIAKHRGTSYAYGAPSPMASCSVRRNREPSLA